MMENNVQTKFDENNDFLKALTESDNATVKEIVVVEEE